MWFPCILEHQSFHCSPFYFSIFLTLARHPDGLHLAVETFFLLMRAIDEM
jgi:hypothetical protein